MPTLIYDGLLSEYRGQLAGSWPSELAKNHFTWLRIYEITPGDGQKIRHYEYSHRLA